VSRKYSKNLPADVIEHWPEIFKDVELKVIPVRYLDSVQVQFNDGKVWDIDLTEKDLKENSEDVESSLTKLFDEYEDDIKHINFKLNSEKIKTDVQRRTTLFLKKKK
jgi:hypothetical protein